MGFADGAGLKLSTCPPRSRIILRVCHHNGFKNCLWNRVSRGRALPETHHSAQHEETEQGTAWSQQRVYSCKAPLPKVFFNTSLTQMVHLDYQLKTPELWSKSNPSTFNWFSHVFSHRNIKLIFLSLTRYTIIPAMCNKNLVLITTNVPKFM